MAGNPERTQKKYKAIEAMYMKLSAKKVNNKTLYSHDAMLEMIADKFFMQPETVNGILSRKK